MGAGRDPSHDDEAIQKGGVAYLKHCIDAAVTMNAPIVVGPLYAAVGRTWQATPDQRKRDLDRCAKNLKQVARHAEDKGITLALEPLNRFETSFINLTEQALELIRMIDSPRVKLMMDTFHANIEEKSLGKAIEAAGLSPGARPCQRERPRDAGTRHVAWNEIAAALKKVKFDGALVIESFSTEVKEIARAAAVWRPLAPTPGGPGKGRPGVPEETDGIERQRKEKTRWHDQSPCSPASGRTSPLKRWRRRQGRGVSTAWSSPAGETISTRTKALEKDSYVREKRALLEKNKLKCFAISTHLIGQCVSTIPSMNGTRACSRTGSGGTANRKGCASAARRN